MRRPLLAWPSATRGLRRSKASGGGGRPAGPGAARQGTRLTPKFEGLHRELARQVARLDTSPVNARPELVVVFDVAGPISTFQNAVRNVRELEWLAESLCDDEDTDADFSGAHGSPTVPRRLYFIAASPRGMAELLSLWKRYKSGRSFARGFGAWKTMFELLRDVRRWGRRDRLDETTLRSWVAELASGRSFVDAEIHLWVRATQPAQVAAQQRLDALLRAHDVDLIDGPLVVDDAGIHAVLARLPAAVVSALNQDGASDLLDLNDVRAFRVAAQSIAVADSPVGAVPAPDVERPDGSPVVAVLDGLPFQNHDALVGRVRIDDPHGWESEIPVDRRNHGTAVCSVVLWGDMEVPGEPPSRPLYVRPVLRPHPDRPSEERGPRDKLFLDVVHEAVARMFEGESPAAPEVAVVNFSVGEENRVFDGFEMSALARLVDYLSWHYQLLFILSAGNWNWDWERFAHPRSAMEDPNLRREEWLKRLRQLTADRMILSPGEAINALTVGALDLDARGRGSPPPFVSPWGDRHAGAPALYSRAGVGLRQSPKPELVAPGGRQPVQYLPRGDDECQAQPYAGRVWRSDGAPGICVAAPGQAPADPHAGARYERGTSYAAPQVTRAAALISDELDRLLDVHPDLLERAPRAVWLKTLLGHAASRARFEDWITPVVEGHDTRSRNRSRRRLLDAFVGYGELDLERALRCTQHRVTIVAGGNLAQDKAHEYRFPLPNGLRNLEGRRLFKRSLRITVGWLAPPWPTSARYRSAVISLDALSTPGLTFNKPADRADGLRNGAGTLIHVVKHGRGVAKFAHDGEIRLKINCRADAATRFDEQIPYAVAATLEVEPTLPVDIYEDVRTRLELPIPIELSGV